MPIRVLHVRASTGFGGAENIVMELCRYLDTSKFECSIYTTFPGRSHKNFLAELAERYDIPCHVATYSQRFSPTSIKRFLDYVDHEKIHIVHTHGYREDILGAIATRFKHVAAVSTIHGWTAGNFRKRIDLWALTQINRIIAVSPTVISELIKAGLNRKKIVHVPNFVDVDHFRKQPPERSLLKKFDIANGDIVIGTAGRLSPEKGLSDLIKAAKIITRQHPTAKFLIVGDGPEKEKLQTLTGELELNDVVYFLGYQDDLVPLYNLMDLYVSPSIQEETPRSILEAAATERPIIATNVGGVSEIVRNKETGILVPPRDLGSLTAGILALIHRRKLCKKLGEEARDHVSKRFSKEIILQKIEAIYYKVFRHINNVNKG